MKHDLPFTPSFCRHYRKKTTLNQALGGVSSIDLEPRLIGH